MAAPLPDFEGALNGIFRGRATWSMQRDVRRDTFRVGFRCTRETPMFEVSHNALEDAIAPGQLLARQCMEVYARHHALMPTDMALPPLLTCPECRGPVDMPGVRKQADYEFCERQAVLWAERAQAVRR